MCNEEEKRENCGCISEILKRILCLQKQDFDNEFHTGCDKPFLGPVCNTICYNTRPIMLFNCCSGNVWSFPITSNNNTPTSVFRIEALDECCATVRLLSLNTEINEYEGTSEFATINLNCVGAIKCLSDTFIELCNN